jgi:cytochrome d ubiquinol oxidase subunit II
MQLLWYVIIAIFWTGFFVLEGFDFGVGALHQVVGHDDTERRVAINTIGPFWDGNEVWLIVAGAATFAAFPGWYATWFSALYLALVLILLALIMRGVSFEFRGQHEHERWRATWSWTLTIGSVLAPLLLGLGLGDLLAGLPIASDQEFTGTFWSLFTPYGVLFGVTLLAICVLHGAAFLSLKSDGVVRLRSHQVARRWRWVAGVLVVVTAVATYVLSGRSLLTVTLLAITVVAAGAAVATIGAGHEGLGFVATAVAIGGTVATLFAGLYPNVMVSSTAVANNLTVASVASGSYALQVMSIVAAIFFPLILMYQSWSYYVFRRRVGPPRAAAPSFPQTHP